MYSNYKMQGDDPPFLPVGTEVSAKYKGAFCEAKIKKVVRNIKCKVTLKAGGITTVNDDVIKGTLRVGNTVEVKQDPKKDAMEAVITKIQDCSQYTVVFDDGDITTLRRSALCLKSGRHFNESETLDQLPLTHPEHFSTPVIAGRRGRRGRAQSEESEGETSSASGSRRAADSEPNVGRVVLVEAAGPAERRRPHQPAFPALVVAPTPQIKVKEDYLVRSFKDGRYYTVPKKEAREFRRGSAPLEWSGVEAALQYLNNGVLPPHWDRDSIFNEPRNTSDDSSDDEPREEKDHFVAQLYKFMDDRGTPLNRNPTIANKDIDLYRLFRVVQKNGGYNRVTNQNQWKTIADKMGFHPVTTSITNLCKQAYKKFLHSFEDFYRKLGVTLVAHPRGARTPPAGRSLIRDRDRQPPPASASPTSSPAAVTATPAVTQRTKEKESDKSETDKSDKSEKEDKVEKTEKMKEKPRASDEDDSADNQPLAATTPKVDKEKDKDKDKDKEKDKDKDKEKEKDKMTTPAEEKVSVPRSQSKTRSLPPVKTEPIEKRTPKRKIMSSKVGESAGGGGGGGGGGRASRRPHVSTDSDSSGRASRCGLAKKMVSRRSQSANSASSGNTVASGGSKRPRNRKSTEPCAEPTRSGGAAVKAQVGDKLKVYYGPTQSESKVTYEAKVIEVSAEGTLRVHYTGWNTRYDEWIRPQRIALNVTQHDARNKKGTNVNRRVRSKRAEESSARSDTDSSDTDEDDKKKLDEKTRAKPPLRSKEAKPNEGNNSSRPRKRPARTISTTSTSSTPASAPKKPRITETSHKGRDYDLNEIRSELKGLQTVKQEAEENVKTESTQKESTPSPTQVSANTETPPSAPVEKQAEDVYEFKEPEPFELELHDEKKKRSHRIFDDISPSKYTSAMSKSLSEEISEDAIRRPTSFRSPSLSPFREFGVTRDVAERQSPEDNSKDGLFSLDDDSLPGEGSSGPIFEGFTPAKNQETYSKKNKVNKLRELIDDSPDSPADDEQSSEEESDEVIKMDQRELSPEVPPPEVPKSPEPIKEDEEEKETDTAKAINEAILSLKDIPPIEEIPEPPKTPPPSRKELVKREISEPTNMEIDEEVNMEPIKVETIPLPSTEPIVEKPEANDPPIEKVEKAIITKIEPPSSPLIDTEEDKSEPDSPARIDVLPVPPPGFLLQSEGPKIAEKLLKAINSAKILSMSPTPTDERPETPKIEIKPVEESIPVTIEQNIVPKPELLKPPTKLDPIKRLSPAEVRESIFGEPSKISDMKHELADIKKVKPKETSPPRLQSPLSILERRKSIADLQLPTPGKNKVLSDTIQKLSSQINQPVAAVSIPIPTFPPADRSDSSDSDDSDQRLIIDKLSVEEWGSGSGGSGSGSLGAGARALHASKSPGEWSAGESLLMLEDACKNERKHSASVVVAGGTRSAVAAACAAAGTGAAAGVGAVAGAGEEDSNLSLLLCEETIPGSPAPDPEPAPPAHHMPFACAPPHHSHTKGEDRHGANPGRERESGSVGVTVGGPGAADAARGAAEGGWGRRRALLAHTPPTASTTPDSSLDLSPHRERRMSERDSPSERKEDEDDTHMQDACAHVGGRSRKASESGAGRTRSRRRRDTDDQPPPPATPPLKYNFYVDLDPSWDSVTRINILTNQMAALRKTYSAVRAELAAIDRRRKKLRRKEREAIKAAKASCS